LRRCALVAFDTARQTADGDAVLRVPESGQWTGYGGEVGPAASAGRSFMVHDAASGTTLHISGTGLTAQARYGPGTARSSSATSKVVRFAMNT
jgi:hypothetical protein